MNFTKHNYSIRVNNIIKAFVSKTECGVNENKNFVEQIL